MKESFKTTIGGQAVIEGIMMRGPQTTAMAVRLPDGSIDVERWETGSVKAWYRKTPFVRGCFNMAASLVTGYKCLMKSAEKSGFDDEQPSKAEQWIADKLGKNVGSVVSVFALVVGAALAIGLFMILPAFLVGLIKNYLPSDAARTLVEGVVKIGIFVLYLAFVSRMPDIRRVFEYHGAEHKTIACYEAGKELTVENVRPMPRYHPRCGTSFLLIVLVISVILFSVVTWNSILYRVLLKIALLPVVVGIAYEIIRFAGRHDNPFTRAISAPGLWLQNLTTYEPDDRQLEVAIASLLPVIPEEKDSDKW